MSKVGIFYGSTGGVTADVAETIKNALELDTDLYEIDSSISEKVKDYDLVILGTSTWGEGDLQDDWDENLEELNNCDYAGKKVALFGVGDQEGYGDTFIDGVGTLYEKLVENGAEVIGAWPTDGYDYSDSTAVKDGKFVGLAIDEDNQSDMTEERVKAWVEELKAQL